MSHVLYVHFAKPTSIQIGCFLRVLRNRGISVSHLGKNDPPRKFAGTIDEAIKTTVGGTDLTNYTFARARGVKLEFDIQIRDDPRWTHSTISASCSDRDVLCLVAESAKVAFEIYIAVLGISGAGKEQPWEAVYLSEKCPRDIQAYFVKS